MTVGDDSLPVKLTLLFFLSLQVAVASIFHYRMIDRLAETIETGSRPWVDDERLRKRMRLLFVFALYRLPRRLSSHQPRWGGFGGRGWPECVQLDQGYATVASSVDSTGASKIMPTAESWTRATRRSPRLGGVG